MSLKLSSIFIIGVITILSTQNVYATTADEFLKHNPTAMDIQAAVDNGTINYSDLPSMFQINIHDHPISYNQYLSNHQNTTDNSSASQSHSSNNANMLIFLIIPLIIIPIIMLRFLISDSNETKRINHLHSLLSRIGILKRNDKTKPVSKDKDLSCLDDSLNDHDYSINPTRQSREVKIKPHHSLLLSLGLAKVVRKDG